MLNSVTEYLDRTAAEFPGKIAFADEKEGMTFAALRQAALGVAAELMRLKIRREPVAVFMDKSPACVAAFLGVAYSGNFYSPVDTKMPPSRMTKIMDTLQPKAVITMKGSIDAAQDAVNHVPHIFYEDAVEGNDCPPQLPQVINTDVLYVLFTSGSTGTPKGVVVPHRAVINYIDWFVAEFDIDSQVVLGNQAPFYFDLSIQDIYATLCSGCKTYLIDEKKFTFPPQLMEFLVERKVNVIMWSPTALCVTANLKGLRVPQLPPLRKVLFCGEVMPNKQLNMWRHAYPQTQFVNLYGPTEACDAMTYYVVDREFADNESLPIGRPIANVEVLLLDDEGNEVTSQAQGELCICGAALAHGYYNAPAQTARAFVQNPLHRRYADTIYRTGDLAHINERGELVYDGRKDFQIKHMGHRIELGEIEAAAAACPGVERSCCLYDAVKEKIVLFYTGETTVNFNSELKSILPEYMVPGKKIRLTEMPLNANGKIDRIVLQKMV